MLWSNYSEPREEANSLLGVTFLSYRTNSWPGVHIVKCLQRELMIDAPRGKTHAESENVGNGWNLGTT